MKKPTKAKPTIDTNLTAKSENGQSIVYKKDLNATAVAVAPSTTSQTSQPPQSKKKASETDKKDQRGASAISPPVSSVSTETPDSTTSSLL